MQSTHGSSKGKGRAEEVDYEQSFASLGLSDYGDHHASRSSSYESSYPDYGSSYEQPYPGDDQYGWMSQSSQSSSAYSGTPGYRHSYYSTTSASSASSNAASGQPTSNNSAGRIKIPQADGHSNVRSSSSSTDSSTPESGSFWLAEDSEEEDKRLEEGHPFIQFKDSAVAKVLEAFRSWRGKQSEQDVPCDGEDESNPAPNEGKGGGKDQETGKRKRADNSDINNSINNSNGSSSIQPGCSKRKRTSDRQLTFACPYTKKDPMSFRGCYKYKLSRIRDVKQHLARCHRKLPYCPRCMDTFETEEERDVHARRESPCPLRPSVELEGISESQRAELAKRSVSNDSPENQWFAIFDIVFPGHEPRPPSPYIDSELLQDITLYQDFLTSNGPRILSEVLEQHGLIIFNYLSNDHDLAALQQAVFAAGLSNIFDQWLARQSSGTQDPDAPSSIPGSNTQDTSRSSSHSRERGGSTSAHESTEGYDYRNESSGTSNYRSYAAYDTASVVGSSVSSYGGGPAAGWSDSQSHGTTATSVPSAHSHRTDVNKTINRQRPPNERYQLPCEFHNLTGCDRVFTGDDEQGWVEHIEGHLQSQFPTRLRCWFCSDKRFDARETSGGDVRSNFITRMGHIRDHFVYDGFRREQIMTDGHLVQHLLDRNIIDRRTYESIINPTRPPPLPGSQGRHSSSSIRSHHGHHGHHGHRRLQQVQEEVVADFSGSRHHSRSEHKRDYHRDHSSGSQKHRSRR